MKFYKLDTGIYYYLALLYGTVEEAQRVLFELQGDCEETPIEEWVLTEFPEELAKKTMVQNDEGLPERSLFEEFKNHYTADKPCVLACSEW